MSIKIVLRKDKINKDGEGPLFLRITENRQSSFLSLNVHVRPEQWDMENEQVQGDPYTTADINLYLSQRKSEALDMVSKFKRDRMHRNPRKIKNLIKYKAGVNFADYTERFLGQIEKAGNLLTYKNYRSSVKKFKTFIGDDDLTFNQINIGFIKRYAKYLEEDCANSKNTIYNNLKVLRKLFYAAVDDGIITYDQNPFLHYKIKREEKVKDFLSESALWQIERKPYSRNSSIEHIRKMFLFSCYSGLRISDIQNLRWSHYDNINNSIIIGSEGDQHSIKLINKALSILNEFRFNKDSADQPHIFPKYSTTYINKNLKIIAQDTSLDKNLKFSTGRNTFIVLALKKGIRMDQIARLLGIKNLKTIEEYAKFVHDDLDMVVGKLNREFL